MRAGKAIRQAQADAAWRCPVCGHAHAHRELPSTWTLVDGAPVEQVHPDYLPGVFHCSADGCACVLDMTGPAR